MDGRNTEDRGDKGAPTDRGATEETSDRMLTSPTVADAGGLGLSMTLLTGVLLALAYYGVQSVDETGLGQAIPTPFYMLALALVFVVEMSRSPSIDARGLARAVGVTAVYGTLVVLAIEGGAYLWTRPEAALDEFAGVGVLAVSLVVAVLVYVGYLSIAQ